MKKIILVVEDDVAYRKVVVEIIENAGYVVLEAGHGKEALEVLTDTHVDIVLADIKMPIMNGLDLLKEIQSLEEGRPKVIMMTCYSIYTRDEAIKAGAAALIEKTSLSEKILAIISSIRFY